MEQETLSVLENTGMSRNEAKVYFTLMRTGPTTATEIARESKMHRTNVYDSLNALIERGLVSYFLEENTKKFKAAEPRNLVTLLQQQEKELMGIIPALEVENKLAKRQEAMVQVHEGPKALRICMFNLLMHNKTIFAYGVPKIMPYAAGPFMQAFHSERAKQKITLKAVCNSDSAELASELNRMKCAEAICGNAKLDSNVSTISCGNEVLIVRWQPVTFTRIVDTELARACQATCEWIIEMTKQQISSD